MSLGSVLDIPAAAALGAVALLEGLRRVPEGALLIQRTAVTPWRILPSRGVGRYWMPWCWSPFLMTVVLSPTSGEASADDLVDKRPRIRGFLFSLLAALGSLVLLVVIIGIPWATGSFGTRGFVRLVVLAFSLSTLVSLLALRAGRAIGMKRRDALIWSIRFMSPFAAPRAAEELLQRSLDKEPCGHAVKSLLNRSDFLVWVRPLTYDLRHRPGDAEPGLLHGLDLDGIEKALTSTHFSEPEASFFCARCGHCFLLDGVCAPCELPLEPFPHKTEGSAVSAGFRCRPTGPPA